MVTRHMPPGCQDMQGPTWHHLESILPPPWSSSYSGSDVGTGEDGTDTSADTGLRSNFTLREAKMLAQDHRACQQDFWGSYQGLVQLDSV